MEGTECLTQGHIANCGGNKTRTQDMWLSAVDVLNRWTKADNNRETLKCKNADVPKRSINPGIFTMGSGLKAKMLCVQGRALAPVTCACSLVPSQSQGSSYTAHSVCFEHSFIFLCFSWCSLCLQSLPAAQMWQKPSLKWASSKVIPLQSLLWFHLQPSPLYQPQMTILHSEFPRHFTFILIMTTRSILCYNNALPLVLKYKFLKCKSRIPSVFYLFLASFFDVNIM